MYSVGFYYDSDTGRKRYAVFDSVGCAYFPKRYGYKAALYLAKKMNKI